MGSAQIPKQTVQNVSLGFTTTGLINAITYLKIDGVVYANGYRVVYNSSSYRNYFAGYNPTTGEVKLYCQAVTYSTTIPAATLGIVEVLIAN